MDIVEYEGLKIGDRVKVTDKYISPGTFKGETGTIKKLSFYKDGSFCFYIVEMDEGSSVTSFGGYSRFYPHEIEKLGE